MNGYLSQNIVSLLRGYCERWKVSGYQAILDTHLLSESALAAALSRCLRLDRLFHVRVNSNLILSGGSISYSLAREWCCIETEAIRQSTEREFAVADPTERKNIMELRRMFGSRIRVVVAPASEIVEAIRENYPIWDQMRASLARP